MIITTTPTAHRSDVEGINSACEGQFLEKVTIPHP